MKITSISLFISSLVFAVETPRTHYTYSYPKKTASCVEEARLLGERMKASGLVKIVSTGCSKEYKDNYDLFVMYTADPLPKYVSSWFDDLYPCTYPTIQECEANLTRELNLFEKHTWVKPFNGYCFREGTSNMVTTPINILIEGFGEPSSIPRFDKNALMAAPLVKIKDFSTSVSEKISQMGLETAQVVVRREGDSFWTILTRYYSKKRVPFALRKISRFGSDKACFKVAAELDAAFQKNAPGTLATFCAEVREPQYYVDLYSYRLETDAKLVFSHYPQPYEKFDLCDKERRKILDLYVNELKRPAFATFCENTADGYKIKVFESYAQ